MAAASFSLPTIALLTLAAFTVAGCGVDIALDDDTTRRFETERIPLDGFAGLDVDTDDGEVSIRAADVERVEVDVTLQESDAGDAAYTITTRGDRLVVRGECDASWWERCRVGFDIVLPPDLDIDVRTDNGAIDVAGIDGDVDVDSGNGEVTLGTVAGAVDVHTRNGRIDGHALGARSVSARSGNGRITLGFDRAPTTVSTTTGNGAIRIRVPDDGVGYDVDADSSHGDVDVDSDLDRDGGADVGTDRRIVATSGNGAIDIHRTDPG